MLNFLLEFVFLFFTEANVRMYLVPDDIFTGSNGRKYLCIVRLQNIDRLIMKYEKNNQESTI